jgi:hypothetical protein
MDMCRRGRRDASEGGGKRVLRWVEERARGFTGKIW